MKIKAENKLSSLLFKFKQIILIKKSNIASLNTVV